ncbi:unnamed protein product [Polarella glacialis]|uniref:Uncharacterized protein n=1 Tax=Polarella glacialis TaxID=89957 RepID=A0A813HXC7_POLGL|nr:unnamed protein product [Polarella glacialis]
MEQMFINLEQMHQGLKCFCKALGIRPSQIAAWLESLKSTNIGEGHETHLFDTIREWSAFPSPQSLFVHGLGKFDVDAAFEKHKALCHDLLKSGQTLRSAECTLGFELDDREVECAMSFPEPRELRLHGYRRFMDRVVVVGDDNCPDDTNRVCLLMLPASDFRLRYFGKYHHWFNTERGVNRLDELWEAPANEATFCPMV